MFFPLRRGRTIAQQLRYCKSLAKWSEIHIKDTSYSSAGVLSFDFRAVSVGFLSDCLLITLEVRFDIFLGWLERCFGVVKMSLPPSRNFLVHFLRMRHSNSHRSSNICKLTTLLIEDYDSNNYVSFQLCTTSHYGDIKAQKQRPPPKNTSLRERCLQTDATWYRVWPSQSCEVACVLSAK